MNSGNTNIPSGKVTFLFTDVEGSTKLSQDFPDKLPSALIRHHAILQTAVESNKGFIFKDAGDAYHCAFANPEDAVNAAVEIQTAHASEKWDETVIKTRIGIHAGNAEWNGKDYMGYITLARTSRVMSAAYGGQILVSDDAYKFCKDNCEKVREKDISFRDLGERRLKDVIEPIRLYQVLSKGLREEFPPLKTLDARPNNLPIQLTSFIGREKEIKDVKDNLKQNRLLTLTGTGGAGKSRLALQTAADVIDEYENGVWFAELAAVSDPEFLTAAINNSLGIKEEPKKTPEETLVDHLKDKEILIILDNCEHLINACADLTERLLSSCPKLKIIATSREALNCSGEQIFKIPALTHPDPNSGDTPEQLTQYESVRLFIERALFVNPKFRVTNENAPALAEVCSRLDGIPLAIELAAARIKVLPIEKIYERLDDRFNLLTGGKRTALPRQQTLRALIDWSYDLLSEEERTLWSRLSVFSGGWTLEAAEEICSDEPIDKNSIIYLLSDLTEKSVIIFDQEKTRYRILETIKQYGFEKLSDKNLMFLHHLKYFIELSEKAEPELLKENMKFWLDIIDADHNNFISAIEWSVNNDNTEKGAIIAAALGGFWNIRGHYSAGIRLIKNILQSSEALDKSLKSKVLSWIGVLKWRQGDYEQAEKYHKENLASGKEIGDKRGIATSLNSLAVVSFYRGDHEQAEKYLKESLTIEKEIGDKRGIAVSINSLGNVSFDRGDFEQAEKYFKESRAILEEFGDKRGMAASINNLGNVSFNRGDYEQAEKYYRECLAIRKEIGDQRGIAASTGNLGNVLSARGDFEQAEKYHKENLAVRKKLGDKFGIAKSLENLGNVSIARGDHKQAEKYHKESLAIRKEIGDKAGTANSMNSMGNVSFVQGDFEQAEKYYKESLAIFKEIGDKTGIAESMDNLGNVSSARGDYEQAEKFHKESLAIRKEIGSKKGIAESMLGAGNIANDQGNYILAIKLLSSSEKIMESIGGVLGKNDQTKKDNTIAKLHEQLSDKEFNKYWEDGKKLTFEEAIALALNKTDYA